MTCARDNGDPVAFAVDYVGALTRRDVSGILNDPELAILICCDVTGAFSIDEARALIEEARTTEVPPPR